MSDRYRQQIEMKERPDIERDLAEKKLTDQEIKDKLPEVWKERADAGLRQISIPIPGTDLHT